MPTHGNMVQPYQRVQPHFENAVLHFGCFGCYARNPSRSWHVQTTDTVLARVHALHTPGATIMLHPALAQISCTIKQLYTSHVHLACSTLVSSFLLHQPSPKLLVLVCTSNKADFSICNKAPMFDVHPNCFMIISCMAQQGMNRQPRPGLGSFNHQGC